MGLKEAIIFMFEVIGAGVAIYFGLMLLINTIFKLSERHSKRNSKK